MNILLLGIFLAVVAFVGVGCGPDTSARPTKGDRAWLLCFVTGIVVAWGGVIIVVVDYFSR